MLHFSPFSSHFSRVASALVLILQHFSAPVCHRASKMPMRAEPQGMLSSALKLCVLLQETIS
jgi:hypothetical protein